MYSASLVFGNLQFNILIEGLYNLALLKKVNKYPKRLSRINKTKKQNKTIKENKTTRQSYTPFIAGGERDIGSGR
jgi:hypothetical protein